MQLDKLLSAADPARKAHIDDPGSAQATELYQRIVGTSPSRGGGGVVTRAPRLTPPGSAARWRGMALAPRRRELAAVAAAAAVVAAALGSVALAGGLRQPRHTAVNVGANRGAAGVLDARARVAASRPAWAPGPGKYLYVLTIDLPLNSVVDLSGAPPRGARFPACGSQIVQEWQASTNLSGRVLGSSPRCVGQTRWAGQSWGRRGDGGFAAGFDYIGWQGLPTKPAAMEAAIVKRYEEGHPSDFDKQGRASNEVTFWLATYLLNVAAPPAVRAAEFRMLAAIPGIRYLGRATDPLGRTGDVLILPQKKPSSGYNIAVMVDPKTSQVLGFINWRAGRPIRVPPRISPWADNFMFSETGVVGSIGATPPGTQKLLSEAEIRYRHWVKPGKWS
jgi:hypothetical protein